MAREQSCVLIMCLGEVFYISSSDSVSRMTGQSCHREDFRESKNRTTFCRSAPTWERPPPSPVYSALLSIFHLIQTSAATDFAKRGGKIRKLFCFLMSKIKLHGMQLLQMSMRCHCFNAMSCIKSMFLLIKS